METPIKLEEANEELGCGPEHSCCVPTLQSEDDLKFKKKLEALEQEWFEASREEYSKLPWYRRPNKTVLYIIVAIYTLSFTVLVSPLVILMLNNICSTTEAATSSATEMAATTTNAIKSTAETASNMMNGGTSGNGNMMDTGSRFFTHLSKRMMNMGGASSICKDNKAAQKTVSNIQSILSTISGVLGFTLSSKFGQLSDRYGRVYIFKFFTIINTINSIFFIVYFQLIQRYNMFLMVVFLSVGYIAGGVMTLISTASGYVSDVEEVKDRAVSISVLMSVIYLAVGVGPLMSSMIIKLTGTNISLLWVSLGLAIIATLLTFTLLVESKNPKSLELANERYHQKYEDSSSSSVKNFVSTIVSFFTPMKRLWLPRTDTGSLTPRINVLTLIFVDIAQMGSCVVTMHVLVLFAVLKYNWSSIEIGYYMSVLGFSKAFVLLAIAPLIHKLLVSKFNYRVNTRSVDRIDRFLIIISMFFFVLSALVVLVTNSSGVVYLSAILESLGGMVSPIVQSSIVKFSSKTESGELFGVIAVVRHLEMFILPIFFLQLYSATVESFPKLFLIIPLVGSAISCVISYFGLKPSTDMTNMDIEMEFETDK